MNCAERRRKRKTNSEVIHMYKVRTLNESNMNKLRKL